MLGCQEDPLLQNVNCKDCNEIFGTDYRNNGSVVPLIGPEGAQMNGWISDIKRNAVSREIGPGGYNNEWDSYY